MAKCARLLLVLLPALGGCLAPYCYPKLENIHSIREGRDPDIHVFRVDVTRHPVKFLLFTTQSQQDQLHELPIAAGEGVPSQTQLSLSRGLGLLGVLLHDDGGHVRHDLLLKLYRPGYELLVLEPGQRADQIAWKPLPDLEAQGKQLDALCSRVKPGSASAAHRDALLFIASEYERLAAKAGNDQAALGPYFQEKAKRLRELAEL